MGTGTGDMIRCCHQVGLPEPLFSISDGFTTTIWRKSRANSTDNTGEVKQIILVMRGEMKQVEIQNALGLRHQDYFREAYLLPALKANYITMTIPDKPKSSRQKYRLTDKGMVLQAHLYRSQ